MCLSLRNTDSRGRSGDPNRVLRMPHLRRWSLTCLAFCLSAISVSSTWGAAGWVRGPGSTSLRHAAFRAAAKLLLLGTRAGERLAGLDLDDFALVADALALVRLGLAHAAEVAGELADQLLVGAGHVDLGRAFQRHGQPRGDRQADRVRVADRQHDVLAALLGLVADALDLQRLLVAVGHALDHVGQERAHQPVQGLARLL